MTALRIRPETIPLPWGVVSAFAVALYAVRSLLRGWDFRPDVLDLVVFGALALLLISRALVKRRIGHEETGAERDRATPHE